MAENGFFSSWREDKIVVKAGENATLYFNDTAPNMFLVQNANYVNILASIGKLPTAESYEFLIAKNSSETIGRPIGSRYLYFYNAGGTDASLTVYSIRDTFDMNILKNLSVAVQGATIQTDGIVRGFTASLPTGVNKIGTVDLTDTVKTKLSDMNNNIVTTGSKVENLMYNGDVSGIVNLYTLLSQLTALTTVTNNVKSALDTIKTQTEKNNTDLIIYEQEAVTVVTTIDFADEAFTPSKIMMLSNDGEKDITVTFYKTSTDSKTFTLKAGESISDLKLSCIKLLIAPKTTGDTISWRYIGGVE